MPTTSKIEPDLATALGEHNADFTEWTYKLKPNVKWEDGTTVTSKQIKYGIERVFATDLFSNGPSSYYLCLLAKCDADGNPPYAGPYKDKGKESGQHHHSGRHHHQLQAADLHPGLRLPDVAAGLGAGAAD